MRNNLSESILTGLKEAKNEKEIYKVYIEETVCQMFEVEASDEDEAAEIAEEKYNNGEFVLEPGELTSKQMMIEMPDGEQTSWNEF